MAQTGHFFARLRQRPHDGANGAYLEEATTLHTTARYSESNGSTAGNCSKFAGTDSISHEADIKEMLVAGHPKANIPVNHPA